ncbi:aspartate aminotransferase family protein [Candidatus Bathyarchaeota archaeon]|nr:aspartate aminotransferase family protein [Candidatus Bathyarchaeota archaeon]
MDESSIMTLEDKYMIRSYAKRPIVISKGEGVYLWDINGKKYLDFTGNYGVCILGYSHPAIVQAIKRQVERLIPCHGSFYNETRAKFLEKLIKIAPKGLTKAFLGNSGAESVECAIKMARKYTGKTEIIAMMGGFHGKTMGALSATWKEKYRGPFQPLVPDFKHVPRFNLQKIKEAITEKTAAIIAEPVQGESGVIVPPEGFFQSLRELCDKTGVLLILDEVQTGMGRTGKMFACEHWAITPDILCVAKSIAGGLPLGATLAKEEIASALEVGEHTSTFGGNPVACAAGCATIDVLIEEKLPEKVGKLGRYFLDRLEELQLRHRIMREVRGLGLMAGVELKIDVLNVILGALQKGVLMLDAGKNVLRFLPPFIITEKDIDTVITVMDEILNGEHCPRTSHSVSN